MQLRHKLNPGWRPPAPETVDAAYEQEIQLSLARTEKAYAKAQKALAAAEAKLSKAQAKTIRLGRARTSSAAVDRLRLVVLARLDELRALEALMKAAPAGRAAIFEGRLKARHIGGKGSQL